MKFPYELMEVVERRGYEETPYFLIQTKSERDGWEVAEIRPDIPNQRKVANLLAAAPELLEALESILEYAESGWDHTPICAVVARSVISKAKGVRP